MYYILIVLVPFISMLIPFTKDFVKAHQREPEPYIIVIIHTLDSFLATLFTDIYCLDPALDVLLGGQFQHFDHLGSVSNMAGTNEAAIWREVLDGDLGKRLIRETDVMEESVDLQSREIVWQVETVGSISAVDDHIKLELPRLGPVLFFGYDESLSTELECILPFVGGVRDDVGFSSERIGPEDAKVTETTPEQVSVATVFPSS